MTKWLGLVLLGIVSLFSCNDDIPSLEFTWLLLGNKCEGEGIMQHLEEHLIDIDPNSDFAYLNMMAKEVKYSSVDLSSNQVHLSDYVELVNNGTLILAEVENHYRKGLLSDKILENLEFSVNLGKDRCCVVACECGTIDTMMFTMFDVGKIKGKGTCRYFRGLAEGPYEEVKKQFDENKDDLPPELVNLDPILESIWSPGESCDYDISDGPCEEANE